MLKDSVTEFGIDLGAAQCSKQLNYLYQKVRCIDHAQHLPSLEVEVRLPTLLLRTSRQVSISLRQGGLVALHDREDQSLL
jgi:hypothetical protein